jgi:hypothetical protein
MQFSCRISTLAEHINMMQIAPMEQPSIATLLKRRNAWLKGAGGDVAVATKRKWMTQFLSTQYQFFEDARDSIVNATDAYLRQQINQAKPPPLSCLPLINALIKSGLAFRNADNTVICDNEGRKYLSGAWLEELAYLAAMEAGAEEALYGQVIGWRVKEFVGENEIDLIARCGEDLTFVSCKALRSELDMQDRKHRNRLMDAVHEADNLTDHFGRAGERVAVMVTTDLFDEIRGVARYNALMGKAAVLDVRIIPLEELEWTKLVAAMHDLMFNKLSPGAVA